MPRTLLAAAACLALLVGCADRGGTARPPMDPEDGPVELQPPGEVGPLPPDALAPEESPALPLVPQEMHELANRVAELFGDSPDAGTTEVSLDRTVLTLRWHGQPPAELLALIDEYEDASFEIRLLGTEFRPGDLLREATRLLREHLGVVTVTGARTEGDGVTVGIDPAAVADPGRSDLAELGITSRFPLFPESVAPPMPVAG